MHFDVIRKEFYWTIWCSSWLLKSAASLLSRVLKQLVTLITTFFQHCNMCKNKKTSFSEEQKFTAPGRIAKTLFYTNDVKIWQCLHALYSLHINCIFSFMTKQIC